MLYWKRLLKKYFGKAARITDRMHRGKSGVIDIELKAKRSVLIYDKSVLDRGHRYLEHAIQKSCAYLPPAAFFNSAILALTFARRSASGRGCKAMNFS